MSVSVGERFRKDWGPCVPEIVDARLRRRRRLEGGWKRFR